MGPARSTLEYPAIVRYSRIDFIFSFMVMKLYGLMGLVVLKAPRFGMEAEVFKVVSGPPAASRALSLSISSWNS